MKVAIFALILSVLASAMPAVAARVNRTSLTPRPLQGLSTRCPRRFKPQVWLTP